MEPQYNWPPQQGYGQYAQYSLPPQPNGYQQTQVQQQYMQQQQQEQQQRQQQQQQEQQQRQQHHYQQQHQQQGYTPQYQQQYAPMPMQAHQGYVQTQSHHVQPQAHHHYPQMAVQMPQSMQMNHQPHQPQIQTRPQPQVVVSARTPHSSTYMQMQPPRIRQVQVQVPVQRSSNTIPQMDGVPEQQRRHSTQQTSPKDTSTQAGRSWSHQENAPRPQQRPMNTPMQKHSQHRTPLQPQSTPQQASLPQRQTPVNSQRSPSIQDPSPKPRSHPKVVIAKSSSHQLTPTKNVHTQQKQLPADVSIMLLSAADEYIAAARGMGTMIVRDKGGGDVKQYQSLMATAMACMDTVLKHYTFLPRDEAKLRLRYASVLIEETDNATLIEEILSKQISLCGRFRLHDLKYATFHLQARYQFKTNHRAAIKSLSSPISEAETFQHIPWVYALRFLKVSLTLQIPGRIETVPVLQQLKAISTMAKKFGDRAVYVACYALEAIVHLRSTAVDRLVQAQTSIAAARSLQLQVSAADLGSFCTLIDMVDIACGVQRGTPDHAKQSALDQIMTDKSEKSAKLDAGVFTILIEKSFGGSLTSDTGGVFQKNADGKDELVFSWLPREDMQALCFHISAMDQSVHEKGFRFMEEAHSRCREALNRQSLFEASAHVAQAQSDWLLFLDWHNVFALGMMFLSQNNHSRAREALNSLKQRIAIYPHDNRDDFSRALLYLSGLLNQSDGLLDSALKAYSSKELAIQESPPPAGTALDFSLLAAINRFLIVRDPRHPEHLTAKALLAVLQPLAMDHPNQYIMTAFRILQGVTTDNVTIARRKTLMQTASNRGRDVYNATANAEFVVVALSILTARFFTDAPNWPQAMNATRRLALRSGKPLWIAVACGLFIAAYERNGLHDEVPKAQIEYESVRSKLPPPFRGQFEEDIDAEGEDDE